MTDYDIKSIPPDLQLISLDLEPVPFKDIIEVEIEVENVGILYAKIYEEIGTID